MDCVFVPVLNTASKPVLLDSNLSPSRALPSPDGQVAPLNGCYSAQNPCAGQILRRLLCRELTS